MKLGLLVGKSTLDNQKDHGTVLGWKGKFFFSVGSLPYITCVFSVWQMQSAYRISFAPSQ